jgi:hypothetical protein
MLWNVVFIVNKHGIQPNEKVIDQLDVENQQVILWKVKLSCGSLYALWSGHNIQLSVGKMIYTSHNQLIEYNNNSTP